MKSYVTLALIILLTVSAQAQTLGWEKVKKTAAGTRGWVRRSLATYPRTSAGNTAFYAAVNANQLPITLTDPKSSPTGTKARLSLSNNLLYIEGAGDLAQLKFERTDGTAMTGSNPDGVALQSGIFYGYGSNSSPPFDRQWKASFSPTVTGKSLKLTFKQSSGGTFTYSLALPTSGAASQVLLFGDGTGTVVTPPVTTTTTIPTSNTALQFNIVAYDCKTGALQWKITSPSSAQAAINSAGFESKTINPGETQTTNFPSDRWIGTFYSGTVSQAGQPTISFNFTTSCSLGPTVTPPTTTTTTPPTTVTTTPGSTTTAGFLAYTDDPSIWVNDLATFENSYMSIKYRKSIGGNVFYLGRTGAADETSLIQVQAVGTRADGSTIWDTGRSGPGWAGYGSPFANNLFCVNGDCTGTGQYPDQPGGIGNNPVMGGSIKPDDGSQVIKARIVQTADRGRVFCRQIRPKQWDLTNKPSHYLLNIEDWFAFDNTLVTRFQIVTEVRPAGVTPATNFEGWTQEELSMYTASKYRQRIIRQNGQDVNIFDSENAYEYSRYTDDGSIGTYDASLNYGLTVYTPDCVAMKSGHGKDGSAFQDPYGVNGPRASSYGFMQSRPVRNLDCPGYYEFTMYAILGSRAEARARLATLPSINTSFDFDFSDVMNWQHGWSSTEALKVESNKLVHYIGAPHYDQGTASHQGSFNSPYRRWEASSIPKIDITMAVTGGANQLRISWEKLASNGGFDHYSKIIQVINDGVERTYTIQMAGTENWTGIINRVSIQSLSDTPNDTKIYPKRIKKSELPWLATLLLLRRRKQTLGIREQKPVRVGRLLRTMATLLLLPLLGLAQPLPGISSLPSGFTSSFYRDNAIRIRIEYPAGTTQASGLLKKGPNLTASVPQPAVIDSSATGLTLYWVDAKDLPPSGWLQISLNNTRVAAGVMNVGYATTTTANRDTLRFGSATPAPTLRFVLPGTPLPTLPTARSIWAKLMDIYFTATN